MLVVLLDEFLIRIALGIGQEFGTLRRQLECGRYVRQVCAGGQADFVGEKTGARKMVDQLMRPQSMQVRVERSEWVVMRPQEVPGRSGIGSRPIDAESLEYGQNVFQMRLRISLVVYPVLR